MIPSLLYLGTSVYLLQLNKSNTDALSSSLYETTEKSTSFILNADRDMYQALTAYQLLVSGTLTAEEKTSQLKVLKDNIDQTNTRVGEAIAILKSKELLQTAHTESKVTIEQSAASFQASFDQWSKEANAVVQAGNVGKGVLNETKLAATFEKGREGLNVIGEILDAYATQSISDIKQQNSKTAQGVYAGVGIIIVLLFGAGGWVIKKIILMVRRILTITGKVAAGDLRHEPQATYSQDELGQISESVDYMVAKMKGLIGTIAHNTQFVHDASVELSDSSKESAHAAEHVASNIQEMTQEVEIQARSSEETSRAIEEMAIGIQRVAENSSVMADHSSLTSQHATLGVALEAAASNCKYVELSRAVVDDGTIANSEVG
ncbi:methyl-accepting chemotaxis protein [Paenibacillus qinlingensis]|uniref:HAMP domain-containing protein/uncharacterized protein YukE n=1 Tax=Paenibacillus qinlingensis TaxID=1837343 RepID=A0ABU1NYY8_9BACL|nr:methyl-accepting chemotaxis protein [Paenibacillus qinlingensis]MDR6552227.1 HAMP domain-containing protein/uncharacterized protein YukE [Paenibacillus qinlingensis]